MKLFLKHKKNITDKINSFNALEMERKNPLESPFWPLNMHCVILPIDINEILNIFDPLKKILLMNSF